MADSRPDFGADFASGSGQNHLEIAFIDEDNLNHMIVVEHQDSEDDFGDDLESHSSSEESEELSEEDSGEEMEEEEEEWSDEITRRVDIEFNESVGMAENINSRNLKSSLDFFELFFTHEVWQLLVSQTNLYAEQKRGVSENSVWYPVTVDEMKAWIALTLDMGIVNKPSLLSYWSTDPTLNTPFFPAVMSRTRFMQILRYLHFVDNSQAPRPDSAEFNKLFKIKPLLDLIIPRFREVYKPERQLAIDETLIKFKGKIHFRQFIPIKPGRFGIKCFTLAESTSGYALESKIYTGKENGVVQKDLGKKVVISLMNPYLDKGYYLFMDNYYTSVALFEELQIRKTLACGTVRSNRLGLPKNICNPKVLQVKTLKRGESLYRQKGKLTCVTWRDRKIVTTLATIPTDDTDIHIIERSVKVNGHWEKKNFPQPGHIHQYNTYMGGVDVSDQRVTAYARLMKGVIWYFKIFHYLLELCISNGHILETKSPHHTSRRNLDFRMCLITELVNGNCFRKDTGPPQIPVAIPDIRFNQDHFHHLVSHNTRSTCKVHLQRVDSLYSCAVCGVRMCPEPCFQRYHTLKDFLFDDERREGPKRLKEGRGRPFHLGRRRTLQN